MGVADTAELSAEQRLAGVAGILAEGILRLRRGIGTEPKAPAETPENLAAPCLENSGETGLNVTCRGTDVVPKKASRRGASNTTPALTTTTLLRERDCHG